MKKLNDLPKSSDEGYQGESYLGTPRKIPICESHKKNWKDHVGYVDNHDGTASCKFCPWGFRLSFMRIHNEKVYDLRDVMTTSPRA